MILTLEERAEFERLVMNYGNASVDLVKARSAVVDVQARVHDSMHAIIEYVNARTARLGVNGKIPASGAHKIVSAFVPVGTLRPLHDAEIARGSKHDKHHAPVADCACATCCEARALASIGKPSETMFVPAGITPIASPIESLSFAAVQTDGAIDMSGN